MFKKTILATLLASVMGGAHATPALQTCSPLEVTHTSGAGLSYSLSCTAGDWRLQYAGSIPGGTDPVNAPYHLTIAGPDGASFVQNRIVRLPAPAKLGQLLAREAVLLDNGDIALRDCKELGCTQYRPLARASAPVKAAVLVQPEVKRMQDEKTVLQQEVAQLRQNSDKARKQADTALAELTAKYNALEAKLKDKLKDESAAASYKQALEKEYLGYKQKIEQEHAKRLASLEADNARLTSATAAMAAERDAALSSIGATKTELDAARKTIGQSVTYAQSVKEAYDFVINNVVSQHNDQVEALKRAMPRTDFQGIVGVLSVPKVNVDFNAPQKPQPASEPVRSPKVGAPAAKKQSTTAASAPKTSSPASSSFPVALALAVMQPVTDALAKVTGYRAGQPARPTPAKPVIAHAVPPASYQPVGHPATVASSNPAIVVLPTQVAAASFK